MTRPKLRSKRLPRQVPTWLRLDNAAKIYPSTRSGDWMAIFRLSVTLKEPLDRPLLQTALDSTIQRIPFFAYRLRRGLFWFFIEEHRAKPAVQDDVANPCAGFRLKDNEHLMFRVRAYHRRIALELFHAVADGTGAMTFLMTLCAEYLRLKHGERIQAGQYVLDCRQSPRPEEWEDSFPRYARSVASSRQEEAAYPLRGTPGEPNYLLLTTGILDTQKLYLAAKRHGATVNTYLASQMLLAMLTIAKKDLSKRRAKKPVKLSMPVNLRRYYPSRTLRNFSSYINAPIYQHYGEYTLDDVIRQVHHYTGLETAEQRVNARFSGNVHAEQSALLRVAPLFLKSAVLKLMYNLTGERYFSSVLSNLGRIDLPDKMARRVERMDFIIGGGRRNPISAGCVSVSGTTTINFSRTVREATLEQLFFTALVKDEVPVLIESNRRRSE